ncbi:hypothetical protein FGO68_gene7086 [Halteria grandinella]|uniref:Uncharacterized protein n=1 Tax=Halteria grandinella TaxID=5974 RepID=A0A8J8SXF3_HALGN|nr:hypothetical protein FGO68_gene7086 [Halteria grandinella]
MYNLEYKANCQLSKFTLSIYDQNCETYELVVNTDKTYEYRKINNGVTFGIIFKFIINKYLIAQPIHALQADIFFDESLKKNYSLSLLTSINHCVLRDAWTIYSFTIINTLLTSTKDIKKAQSLLPIILNVSNFNDSYQIPNNAKIMDTLSHLRELAKYRGLQATLMSIVNSNNKQICKMQLQLQGNQGRKLNLTINKSLMVMINNNEEVKIETQNFLGIYYISILGCEFDLSRWMCLKIRDSVNYIMKHWPYKMGLRWLKTFLHQMINRIPS